MATTYVDRVYLTIDGTEHEATSVKTSVDASTEPIPTMNRENRAKGHKHGVPVWNITTEVPIDVDAGVDFETMLEDGDLFTTTVEEEGGLSRAYLNCKLAKVDLDSKVNDTAIYNLEMNALDRVAS